MTQSKESHASKACCKLNGFNPVNITCNIEFKENARSITCTDDFVIQQWEVCQ